MIKTIAPSVLAGEIFDIITLMDVLWDQHSWFCSTEYLSETSTQDIETWLDELENPTCGTTACVAGWAAIKTAPRGSKITDMRVIYPDGSNAMADEIGREALGLDYWDGEWLFSSSRSRDEVLRALAAIRDGEEFDRDAFEDEYVGEDYDDYEEDDYVCNCGCMDCDDYED